MDYGLHNLELKGDGIQAPGKDINEDGYGDTLDHPVPQTGPGGDLSKYYTK